MFNLKSNCMNQFKDSGNGIVNRSFKFSLKIIDYCTVLENNKKQTMAYQLFRSGTSIGANVAEAQHAESMPDFIHKMKIASKEASETAYWLSLCKESAHYPDPETLIYELEPIIKIVNKIIITSKHKIADKP